MKETKAPVSFSNNLKRGLLIQNVLNFYDCFSEILPPTAHHTPEKYKTSDTATPHLSTIKSGGPETAFYIQSGAGAYAHWRQLRQSSLQTAPDS